MLVDHRIGNIEEALQQLGVTENSLSEAEKASLDRLGYVLIPGVIDAQWLDRLRQRARHFIRDSGQLMRTQLDIETSLC